MSEKGPYRQVDPASADDGEVVTEYEESDHRPPFIAALERLSTLIDHWPERSADGLVCGECGAPWVCPAVTDCHEQGRP